MTALEALRELEKRMDAVEIKDICLLACDELGRNPESIISHRSTVDLRGKLEWERYKEPILWAFGYLNWKIDELSDELDEAEYDVVRRELK